ncbi:MAG TPA: thermonuclease family protein [Isosphaeraceae bacterium]
MILVLSSGCGRKPSPGIGEVYTATVTAVPSGDVIEVRAGRTSQRVRLFGVDAPETDQAYFKRSAAELGRKLLHKSVRVRTVDYVLSSLPNAWVWLAEAPAEPRHSANHEQVAEGWAWYYARYADTPDTDCLADAERQAKGAKRGLWTGGEPAPPWASKKELSAILIVAITRQLDALESITTWTLLVAVVTCWTALRQTGQLEVLGLKVEAGWASTVAMVLYLVVNVYAIILFWRLGDTLNRLHTESLNQALLTTGVHTWLSNPFGVGSPAIGHAGLGLLIFLWWFCTASVALLEASADPSSTRLSRRLRISFLATGVAALLSILRVYAIGNDRVTELSGGTIESWASIRLWGTALAILGLILGIATYSGLLRLQRKWRSLQPDPEPVTESAHPGGSAPVG